VGHLTGGNQTQAKGSTVRLIIPRDPEVVEVLGRELGSGPTDEDLLSTEKYLLEHGYVVPVDIGLTRGAYTITAAGLRWLDRGLSEAPVATLVAPGEARSEATPDFLELSQGGLEHTEGIGSIGLRGERDRLLQELEQQRLRVERLEAELERRCLPWWRRMFGV
jgi:hypothetical protein